MIYQKCEMTDQKVSKSEKSKNYASQFFYLNFTFFKANSEKCAIAINY